MPQAPASLTSLHMDKPLIKINLAAILNKRLGTRAKWVPAFLLHALERLVRQDELNSLLERAYPAEGSAFSRRILHELSITLEVEGLDRLPDGEAFEFVSNHPLGGLDGMALVGVLGEHYGDGNLRVLVNDMLMHVTPLADVFLPVNKYGSQGREAARQISEAFASGRQIVMFPAGLVSRRHPDGSISDLEWQKSCIVKALESGRRIVPVYFDGLNSPRFYRVARWRKLLGLRVNIEQALLPGELCDARGRHYRIIFGTPVDVAALRAKGHTPSVIAATLRRLVYRLSDNVDKMV